MDHEEVLERPARRAPNSKPEQTSWQIPIITGNIIITVPVNRKEDLSRVRSKSDRGRASSLLTVKELYYIINFHPYLHNTEDPSS